MIKRSFLAKKLSKCCELDAFLVSRCTESEVQALKALLPEVKSVIVFAHHVKHALEWVWFPLESERMEQICAAELHLKSECEKIIAALSEEGCKAVSIPYPGRCGIRFKDLAHKTGLGKIGDNFMFLHKEWGPWTQLKVLITDAEITDSLPDCKGVCSHCGICKTACPADAIKEDTLLGIECNKYQCEQDEKAGIQGSYIYKCEVCAHVCPIGESPEKVIISKKYQEE